MIQPRSARPSHRPARTHLRLEALEDRNLLSGAHPYADSEILVRFRSEAAGPALNQILAGTAIGPDIPLVPGLHKVTLPRGTSVQDAVAAYSASPLVRYAEPDYPIRLTDTTPNDPAFVNQWNLHNTGQTGGTPGADISAPAAWDVTTGSTNVTVAVIDTGVDYTHPDLYENIWINQAEIPPSRMQNLVDVDGDGLITFYDLNDPINQGPGKVTDLTGKGYIDATDILAPMDRDSNGNDLGTGGWAFPGNTQDGDTLHPNDFIGWNDFNNNNTPVDRYGHGTHVAGILGAVGNNGVGIAGINWNVQIMPLRIFADDGGLTLNDKLIDMLSFAVQHGAFLSNNSYNLDFGYSQAVRDAIDAAGQAGHIYVVAASNEGQNIDQNPSYPSSFQLPNEISVAATTDQDARASFSNYGQMTVHLGAPGQNVYSTLPTQGSFLGRNYGFLSGTSMASPHVAGVVALVMGLHPDWDYTQIINAVLSTVDPIPALNGRTITGGRLNAAAAVRYGGGAPVGGGGGSRTRPALVGGVHLDPANDPTLGTSLPGQDSWLGVSNQQFVLDRGIVRDRTSAGLLEERVSELLGASPPRVSPDDESWLRPMGIATMPSGIPEIFGIYELFMKDDSKTI